MNNSFIAIESIALETPVDNTVRFRERESELIAIIEAFETVGVSSEWKVLKEKVWDGVVVSLLKQRDTEVEKKPLNGPLIHSINGQLAWAKKYLNITDLASIYKTELTNVRSKLNAT